MRKFLAAIFGSVLTLAGIALLVLPGPGFVLIAAGLAVLARYFPWARKPLNYAKEKAAEGIDEIGRSKSRLALAGICALALVAVGIVDLTHWDVPYVTTVSAVLLIVSGLGLIGTLVYAERRKAQQRPQRPSDLSR